MDAAQPMHLGAAPTGTTATRTTTRAALWSQGSGIEIHDLPLPEPGPGEALVRVDLTTVCGSDRHTVSGRRHAPSPSVLGHEAVGRLERVGTGGVREVGGDRLREGDRVVWGVTISCGDCDRCRTDRSAKCRSVRKVGHEPARSRWPLSGTYAQHLLLPAGATLVRVPDAVSDEVAAPAACATATVMAALEAAGPLAGRRVLVSGAGMLGLVAVAASREAGAAGVVVTDIFPERLAAALELGADTVLGADEPPAAVDIALEVSGAPAAVVRCLEALDLGGVLVLAGSVSPGPDVALSPERLVRQWLTVRGVHNYEPRHLQRAVGLLVRTPHLDWSALVEPAGGLDELPAVLAAGTGIRPRVAIRP